jgi:hypothetical protein
MFANFERFVRIVITAAKNPTINAIPITNVTHE